MEFSRGINIKIVFLNIFFGKNYVNFASTAETSSSLAFDD
jgi:hypothetical protein